MFFYLFWGTKEGIYGIEEHARQTELSRISYGFGLLIGFIDNKTNAESHHMKLYMNIILNKKEQVNTNNAKR